MENFPNVYSPEPGKNMTQDLQKLFGLDKLDEPQDPRRIAAVLREASKSKMSQIIVYLTPEIASLFADMIDFSVDQHPNGIPPEMIPPPLDVQIEQSPINPYLEDDTS
jgi:hypothetical protein